MSETTVNINDLSAKLDRISKIMESLPSGNTGKGETADNGSQAPEKTVKQVFAEYLQSDKKTFEEAIGAQGVGSATPLVWAADPEILSPAGADGYFLSTPAVTWKNDVKGKPGNTVYVQTIGVVSDAAITSGTEPTFTASTISSVPVTLTQRGHGIYITKADMEDMMDVSDKIMVQSKNSILRSIDAYFLEGIQAADANCGAGTIAAGGVLGATTLASMWGSLMAGSYIPKTVVCHPVQYASLLKDSQFTNAATAGDKAAITSGKIPTYLGMDIVPLVQGTLANGTFSPGTYKAFMLAEGAMAGAIKRAIDVEKEYYVKDQRTYIVSSVRFGGTVVHTAGIGLITSVSG